MCCSSVQSSGRRKLKRQSVVFKWSVQLCNKWTWVQRRHNRATVQRCQSAVQQCNSEGGWPSSHATGALYSLSQAFSNHTLIIVIINFSMYIPSFKWKDWKKIIWVNISLKIQIYKDLLSLGLSLNLSKLSSIFSESFRFFRNIPNIYS